MKFDSLFRAGLRLMFLAIAPGIAWSPASAKSNDDVVVLHNGDHITGEIKSLDQGQLIFKSAYMLESVRLDWKRVAELDSKDTYLILLTSGNVFTARIQLKSIASASPGSFSIHTGTNSLVVRQTEVIRIRPAEEGFWAQLSGKIELGFSYTSGNQQYETQFAASAAYRRAGREVTADLSSLFGGQSDGSSTRRNTFNSQYRRRFNQKWFYGGIADLLNSEEQSLSLRTSLGGLIGRSLIQTNRTSLAGFGGVAVSRERYSSTDGRPAATTGDSLVGIDFSTFRFRSLDISTRLLVWPSLTDRGRVRSSLNSNFQIELVKDLFWNLSFYENYDNKPPVNANRNDLGVTTSFGWKF